MAHRPDIGIFVGDGHYGCAPMVEGLQARGLQLVGKLRCNAVLWVPWTEPPAQVRRALRPRRHPRPAGHRPGGRGQAAAPCAVDLQALQVSVAHGLRLGRRRRPGPGPLFDGQRQAQIVPATGVASAFRHGRAGPHPAKIPAGPPGSGPNRAAAALKRWANPEGFVVAAPIPALRDPGQAHRAERLCQFMFPKLFTPLIKHSRCNWSMTTPAMFGRLRTFRALLPRTLTAPRQSRP